MQNQFSNQQNSAGSINKGMIPVIIISCFILVCFATFLMALLLPFLIHAPPKTLTCVSNLRNLATASLMYAQDYDERFPLNAQYSQSAASNWDKALFPYLKSATIYHCPQDEKPGGISYLYNDFLHSAVQSKVDFPSNTTLLIDSSHASEDKRPGHGDPLRYNVGHSIANEAIPADGRYWESPARKDVFRHNGKATLTFLDGHVKASKEERIFFPRRSETRAFWTPGSREREPQSNGDGYYFQLGKRKK